jgi:transcriptional regulator with XRE-family HTH domain
VRADSRDAITDVGLRIAEIRRARGWTQQEVASAAAMRPSDYQRIEAGKRNVTLRSLERVATALGVPLRRLFDVPSPTTKRRVGRPRNA